MIERQSLATIQFMALRTTGSHGYNNGIQNPKALNESLGMLHHHKNFNFRQLLPHRCGVMIYYLCGSHLLSPSVSPMTRIGRKEDPEIW